MHTVVCWCCECFETLKIYDGKLINGSCAYKNILCYGENAVCEDFILSSGLHTTRTVPDYRKNYQ